MEDDVWPRTWYIYLCNVRLSGFFIKISTFQPSLPYNYNQSCSDLIFVWCGFHLTNKPNPRTARNLSKEQKLALALSLSLAIQEMLVTALLYQASRWVPNQHPCLLKYGRQRYTWTWKMNNVSVDWVQESFSHMLKLFAQLWMDPRLHSQWVHIWTNQLTSIDWRLLFLQKRNH